MEIKSNETTIREGEKLPNLYMKMMEELVAKLYWYNSRKGIILHNSYGLSNKSNHIGCNAPYLVFNYVFFFSCQGMAHIKVHLEY